MICMIAIDIHLYGRNKVYFVILLLYNLSNEAFGVENTICSSVNASYSFNGFIL